MFALPVPQLALLSSMSWGASFQFCWYSLPSSCLPSSSVCAVIVFAWQVEGIGICELYNANPNIRNYGKVQKIRWTLWYPNGLFELIRKKTEAKLKNQNRSAAKVIKGYQLHFSASWSLFQIHKWLNKRSNHFLAPTCSQLKGCRSLCLSNFQNPP